ncbi:MAG: 5-formyltetrahydrofolate cyclo-ligase [Anaerolineae bacterium]
MPAPKEEIRHRIWALLVEEGVARFPLPIQGRIPNFVGAEGAASRLARLPTWRRAKVIKANPDSPQRPVRERALRAGKTVYMAVPRLRKMKPFIELEPRRLDDVRRASTIRGAFALGRPVSLDDMPPIDVIVAGSVAVNRVGARIGKGGGYSDLEYAIGRQAGLIGEDTVVVTTVHPLQIVEEELEMTEHDIPVDIIVTPDEVIYTEHRFPKPLGIYWDHLSREKIEHIPVLRAWAEMHLEQA